MRRVVLALALLFAASFVLRSFGIGLPFGSNDAVEVAFYSSCGKDTPAGWLESLAPTRVHSLLGLFAGFAWVRLLGFIGLRVTEYAWNLPYALMGSLTVLSVFLLVKAVFKKDAPAFGASLLVAVLPLHVVLSHSSGHPHCVFPFLLESAALTAFYYYHKRKSRRMLAAATLLSAASTLSHAFFPLFFAAVVYLGACFAEGHAADRLARSASNLLRAYLREPLLAAVLAAALLLSSAVSLYHSGASFGYLPGVHMRHYLLNMLYFIDVIPAVAGLFCLAYSVRYLKAFDLRGLPAVLFVSYSMPFLLVFDRCLTSYFILPAVYLAVLAGAVLGEIAGGGKFKAVALILLLITASLLLARTLEALAVVKLAAPRLVVEPGRAISCGSLSCDCIIPCTRNRDDGIYPDGGIKAAAYWIRENTHDSAVVFSDASDGAGLEANILGYYVHRNYVCLNDANMTRVTRLFEKRKGGLDVLLIRPVNEEVFVRLTGGGFHKTAVVEDSDGKPLLLIYTRLLFRERPDVLSLEENNRLYDLNYADVKHITDCPLPPLA